MKEFVFFWHLCGKLVEMFLQFLLIYFWKGSNFLVLEVFWAAGIYWNWSIFSNQMMLVLMLEEKSFPRVFQFLISLCLFLFWYLCQSDSQVFCLLLTLFLHLSILHYYIFKINVLFSLEGQNLRSYSTFLLLYSIVILF